MYGQSADSAVNVGCVTLAMKPESVFVCVCDCCTVVPITLPMPRFTAMNLFHHFPCVSHAHVRITSVIHDDDNLVPWAV